MNVTPKQTIDYDHTYELWGNKLSSDKLGQVYDTIGWDSWRGMIRQELLTCLKHYPIKTILDVGCFRGDYLQVLLDQNQPFIYEGVDIAPSYIQTARDRYATIESTPDRQFRFDTGNIFNLKYPDNHWDLVFCTGVLLHLPELDRPLSELFRVTGKYLLLGIDIHPETDIAYKKTVKNGFLYQTWSEKFIFDQIKPFGDIIKVSRYPSPDYPYSHYVITVKK